MESHIVILLLIMFLSTFIRSTFGFGDAVLGMPLLALTIGVITATPLMALTALTIALTILARNWSHVQFQSTWRLIISSLLGIPVGIYFIKGVNEAIVKGVLALFIIMFALYKLINPKLKKKAGENLSYFVGLIAGILGGAYNTNGPPVVLYASLKQWPPISFRATLQGYFFSTGIFVVLGHALAGNYTPLVLRYYLFSIPVVFLAIYSGGKLNRRFSPEKFIKYIYWFLIIVGIMLLISTLKH